MPYCTVDDVQALRPQVPITASSRPTTAQVNAQIGDLTAYVDGVLSGLGLVVPITGPISLAYLKAAVAWGVAGLAELQQTAGIAAQGQVGDTVRSQYWALFQAALDNIKENPKSALIDAAHNAAGGAQHPPIESFFTRYPDDDQASGQRGRLTGTAVPRFRISQEW